jgi:hypothetical protein
MAAFKGRELKPGLTIDTHIVHSSGETMYTVCDQVGRVYDTIFESKLEPYFAEPLAGEQCGAQPI